MSGTEFNLSGKVVLVTGGAGLIGSEVCDALAAYGADVVLTDIHPQETLEEKAHMIAGRNRGANVLPVRADVTSDESTAALFEAVEKRFQRLDVLVNLAAIDAKYDQGSAPTDEVRFEKFPLDLWEKSVAVNCTGMLRVTQGALKLMLEQGTGNIINAASTYSLVAPNHALYRYPGDPTERFKPVDYVGTKSFVPGFTKYLATLYGSSGIRANCIAPHGVDSNHPEKFRKNFDAMSPLGRMCDVRELRGPFVFLAAGASSYMTGSVLVVDGGWTVW